jgi:hypothetical protein
MTQEIQEVVSKQQSQIRCALFNNMTLADMRELGDMFPES